MYSASMLADWSRAWDLENRFLNRKVKVFESNHLDLKVLGQKSHQKSIVNWIMRLPKIHSPKAKLIPPALACLLLKVIAVCSQCHKLPNSEKGPWMIVMAICSRQSDADFTDSMTATATGGSMSNITQATMSTAMTVIQVVLKLASKVAQQDCWSII